MDLNYRRKIPPRFGFMKKEYKQEKKKIAKSKKRRICKLKFKEASLKLEPDSDRF